MDGHTYFVPQLNYNPDKPSCSFIRHGKIKVGGIDFKQALLQKYKPDHMMSEQERKQQWDRFQADLYVNTDKKGGMKKIEILGVEQSYEWRADVSNARDIALEEMKISSLGDANTLKQLIPGAFNLYLDRNLLYSWDQYFEIIR